MSSEDLWRGETPPDVTGVVMVVALASAVLAWPSHDPGTPAEGVLLVAVASGLSVAAWATVMGLAGRVTPVLRAGLGTVACVAVVAWFFSARASVWPVAALTALTLTARLERPPGHRVWRHVAIAVALVLAGLVVSTV